MMEALELCWHLFSPSGISVWWSWGWWESFAVLNSNNLVCVLVCALTSVNTLIITWITFTCVHRLSQRWPALLTAACTLRMLWWRGLIKEVRRTHNLTCNQNFKAAGAYASHRHRSDSGRKISMLCLALPTPLLLSVIWIKTRSPDSSLRFTRVRFHHLGCKYEISTNRLHEWASAVSQMAAG